MSVANQPLRQLGSASAAIAIAARARRARPVDLSAVGPVQRVALETPAVVSAHACSGAAFAARSPWRWRWRCRPALPERDAIILTAFVVVAFSILVQGLTMPWLIKRFDLAGKEPDEAVAAAAAAG